MKIKQYTTLKKLSSLFAMSFFLVFQSHAENNHETIAKDKNNLKTVKISISMKEVSTYRVIDVLKKEYNIPVSFIEAEADGMKENKISINVKNINIDEVFDILIAKNPVYKVNRFKNRYVFYNNSAHYNYKVDRVNIHKTERYLAARQYVSIIKKRFSEFKNFYGPPAFGNMSSPVFKDQVTLQNKATILDHLIELLGNDTNLAFTIIKYPRGTAFFINRIDDQGLDIDLIEKAKTVEDSKNQKEQKN